MCNIVTEFYLYSIVYIYLINSRLDVTFSVRHHFRIANFISLDNRLAPMGEGVVGGVHHTKGNILCTSVELASVLSLIC